MVIAHDCRLIMGPGRQGDVFGIVAMVSDGMLPVHSVMVHTDY